MKLIIIIAFIVFAGSSIATARDRNVFQTCPSDYEYYAKGNKCFKLYSDGGETWYDARKQCQSEKADLVIINDVDTSHFIQDLLRRQIVSANKRVIWLGLREIGNGPELQWVDDSPVTFQEWRDGEPNNDNVNKQDCVLYRVVGEITWTSFWNDLPCSAQIGYVCEKPLDVFPVCPSGYMTYPEGHKCVKFSNNRLTWDNARVACQRDGGDLIVLSDEPYNTFILAQFKGYPRRSWKRYSIGFRNSTFENLGAQDFSWIDGTSLDNSSSWASGQPDFDRFSWLNLCGQIVSSSSFEGWNDIPCHESYQYICDQDIFEPMFCLGDHWNLNERNKKCYRVMTEAASFDRSRAECKRWGGDLVTLTDTETKDYIISLVDPSITDFRRFWIGLIDPNKDGYFEWLDGSRLDSSEPTRFSSITYEFCGTLQYDYEGFLYSDMSCYVEYPSICQNEPFIPYPLLVCPRGYTTHVSTHSEWQITCLMAEDVDHKTRLNATDDCWRTGGELFAFGQDGEEDLNAFIKDDLMYQEGSEVRYWSKARNCVVYNREIGEFSRAPCDDPFPYVCRHQGNIKTIVNLKELAGVADVFSAGDFNNISLADDVCQVSEFDELYDMHQWARGSPYASVTADIDFLRLITGERHSRCLLREKNDKKCCVMSTLERPGYSRGHSELNFPLDKILCICPEENKVTKEVITFLKNITKPKNDTAPQNSLCPCRCDSLNVNLRPSSEELSQMIFKIQKELKVDTAQLSSKRNKKISAKDDRTESMAIGYVGIALCLVPLCLLIAIDMSRFVKFIKSMCVGVEV